MDCFGGLIFATSASLHTDVLEKSGRNQVMSADTKVTSQQIGLLLAFSRGVWRLWCSCQVLNRPLFWAMHECDFLKKWASVLAGSSEMSIERCFGREWLLTFPKSGFNSTALAAKNGPLYFTAVWTR